MSSVWLLPTFAHAQVIPGGQSIWQIGAPILTYIMNTLIPILVTVAVIILIVNIIRFIIGAKEGKVDNAAAGKQLAWSIGGLFIILAIWGIIAVISKTLGIGVGGAPIDLPRVPFP